MENLVQMEIQGKTYTVSYPNVGEYCRIEALKQQLSNTSYGLMMSAGTVSANHALDMIDIHASLMVLAPQLINDLKIEDFSKLGIADYKIIRDEYIAKVTPFFNEINNILSPKQ